MTQMMITCEMLRYPLYRPMSACATGSSIRPVVGPVVGPLRPVTQPWYCDPIRLLVINRRQSRLGVVPW